MASENGGFRKWLANRIYHEQAPVAPIATPKPKYVKVAINQVKDVVKQAVGVYQIPSFDSLLKVFNSDQVLRDGIFDFADEVVSSDIFVTVDKDYTFTVNSLTAQDVLNKWVADNHIFDFIRVAAGEVWAFGNSFGRFSNSGGGMSRIPLEAGWHMVPTSTDLMGPPIQEKYHLQLTPIYSCEFIDSDSLIHFRLNALGRMEPFGIGIIQGITARPQLSDGTTIPSPLDLRYIKRQVLAVGMTKWAQSNSYIFVPELPEDEVDELSEKFEKMSPYGNRLIINKEGKIQLELPERSDGYNEMIESMDSEFLAVIAPWEKLGLGSRQTYTKSTASQQGKVLDRRLNAVRNVFITAFRDIFISILKSAGFDKPENAHAELGFSEEESPAPTVGDLILLVSNGVIVPNECRQLLRENQKLNIQGDVDGGDKPRQQMTGQTPNPEARDVTREAQETT